MLQEQNKQDNNKRTQQHHTYDVKSTAVVENNPKIEGYDFEPPFDFQKFLYFEELALVKLTASYSVHGRQQKKCHKVRKEYQECERVLFWLGQDIFPIVERPRNL